MVNVDLTTARGDSLLRLATLSRAIGAAQKRLATGKRVADASDNPSVWSEAARMTAATAGLDTVQQSLGIGRETVFAARSGAEQAVSILDEMRALIVQGNDPASDREALQNQLEQLKDQYWGIVDATVFNGVGLLGGGDPLSVTSNVFIDGDGAVRTTRLLTEAEDIRFRGDYGSGADVSDAGSVGTGSSVLGPATVSFVDYTPSAGDSFRITVEGEDYEYVASAGDTGQDVVDKLFRIVRNGIDARGLSINAAQTSVTVLGVTTNAIVLTNTGVSPVEIEYSDAEDGTPSSGGSDLASLSVRSDAEAAQALVDIDAFIGLATAAASRLGSSERRFDIQSDYLAGLEAAYEAGISSYTDANIAEEQVRLDRLNARYELALRMLSAMAGSQRSVLQLFA